MTPIDYLRALGLTLLLAPLASAERPHIVWVVVEDTSCHFGYQGEPLVDTPNLDRLASEGVVFRNAYVTSPVCSTSRSALVTGMHPTTLGVHHHRSSRGALKIELPGDVPTVPELMKHAGYFTCNLNLETGHAATGHAATGHAATGHTTTGHTTTGHTTTGHAAPDLSRLFVLPGKEDYNFVFDTAAVYEPTDWSARADGQPVFAQVHLHGGKLREKEHEYRRVAAALGKTIDPADVTLPPYYPDHPGFRRDWARYLDTVSYTDWQVGLLLDRLRGDGLLENTVLVFLTDHGVSQARGKQFLYDEGARVPLIVWAPGLAFEPLVRDELVLHLDVAATTLDLAGVALPERMQGRPLFGDRARPRQRAFLARDRCDETVDHIRAVREGRFKYIRNYLADRPYLQPCAYKDNKPIMVLLRGLHAAGRLNAVQSRLLAATRPAEELYDLQADPFEVRNLIDAPEHAARVAALRRTLDAWEEQSGDQGRRPEPAARYDSDMRAYLNSNACRKNPAYARQVEANIATMKRWQAEGR